ncbi:hypothetical protein ACHAXM_009480 [Skeletonema potamos]|jgi:hypothetical protein
MPSKPPPTSYSDKVGYSDHIDADIEALASRALSPISDFPPDDSYEMDHYITSSDEDDDDDDLSLSDEEGQRDAVALHKKTSDILNEFEDFVHNVNKASSPAKEIMSTIISGKNRRDVETVKNRNTAGGGDATLKREWSYDDRNLHDIGFGSDCDESDGGDGSNKYEKRGLFKYAVPFFHSKTFKIIAVGVAVVFVLVLIVGSMSSTGDRVEVEELDDVVGDRVEAEELDDVVKWFYQQTECNDHPSAEVQGEGHGCAWIHNTGRVPLRHARCGHDTTYKKKSGEFLLVKEVCKKSCDECGDTESSATVATEHEAPKPEKTSEGQTTAEAGEMTNWMTPVTLNNDSSSADCTDDLTKVVAIGGKTCETYFSGLNLEHLKELRCSHQTDIENSTGNGFLYVKDVCKMSCGLCGVESNLSVTGQVMEVPSNDAVEEASAPLDVPPKEVIPSTLETAEQAQSNAESTSAAAETTLLDSPSSPVSAETMSIESGSSPSTQHTQESSSTADVTASVFTREEGWKGFSRPEAIGFCSGKALTLCTFEAVCPHGEGNDPAFGAPAQITWVPLSDGSDWVQVGAGDKVPCEQWSKMYGGSPPWANAGEVIEEITGRIYCCESENPVQDAAAKPTGDIASNTIEDVQSIPASHDGLSEQQAYNNVANRFAPKWFNRSTGWQGTTFEAAVQFCLSLEQNMILCPFEAYCPMGPSSKIPFGGLIDEPTGSLAPTINNRNWWVHVGGNNVCKQEGLDVNWGSDGSNEDVTRHIMCCKNGK